MTARSGRLVRAALVLALLGLSLAGCGGGSDPAFAGGVRVDQLAVRDVAVTVTDTTSAITWTSRDPDPTQLSYGLTRGLGTAATGAGAKTQQHRVDLTGLTPGTLYWFRISGSANTLRFKTMGAARQRIAFVSDRADGRREIYLCYEWGENVTRMTTTGGTDPSLSRDGTRIAWVNPGAGNTGDIWMATLDANGLVAGTETNVTNTPDRDEASPDWSPDGTQLVFVAKDPGQASQLVVHNVASGAETVLLRNGASNNHPRWRPDGTQIAFASNMRTATVQLGARPVDAGSLTAVMDNKYQTPIDPSVIQLLDSASGLVDLSGSPAPGQTVLISYTSNGVAVVNEKKKVPLTQSEIWTVNADGTSLRRLTTSGGHDAKLLPSWNPQAPLLAVANESGAATNLITVSADNLTQVGITRGAYYDRDPVFSPDGTTILFSSNRDPNRLVHLYLTDLQGNWDPFTDFSSGDTQPSWSVVP